MPLAILVPVLLLVAAPLIEVQAEQQRSLSGLGLPMFTAETPKQCRRVCRKGKPCANGCISATKQCKAGRDCACAASGES